MTKHPKKTLFNLPTFRMKNVKVQLSGSKKAKIARVFIVGNFSRKFEDAKNILTEISKMDFEAEYLLTPSAFILIPWKFSSFDEAASEGKKWASKLLGKVEINAEHVFIGIDSYSGGLAKPHVELSVLCSPEPWHVTGKIYPIAEQQKGLIRADMDSHFVELGDRVMALCCHDLTIFNPRSDAVATGWRKIVKESFKSKVADFKPEIVLHHTHYTDTPYTWIASWRALQKITTIKHYATSGVFYREDGVRAKIEETLKLTRKGSILDIVVSDAAFVEN